MEPTDSNAAATDVVAERLLAADAVFNRTTGSCCPLER
jgi:hypothetical protein